MVIIHISYKIEYIPLIKASPEIMSVNHTRLIAQDEICLRQHAK